MWVADHDEMKTLVALESVRHSKFHKKGSEKRKTKIHSQKRKERKKEISCQYKMADPNTTMKEPTPLSMLE